MDPRPETSDLAVTVHGRAQLGARARGFDGRLRGLSRYANPYAERIAQVPDARRPGWLYSFAAAWWEGWNAADSITPPAPHITVDPPEEP